MKNDLTGGRKSRGETGGKERKIGAMGRKRRGKKEIRGRGEGRWQERKRMEKRGGQTLSCALVGLFMADPGSVFCHVE